MAACGAACAFATAPDDTFVRLIQSFQIAMPAGAVISEFYAGMATLPRVRQYIHSPVQELQAMQGSCA